VRRPGGPLAALAALTAVALALRIAASAQDLFGDELWTYDIVTGRGLGEVMSLIRETSITPPLHYVLAWLSVGLGEPQVTLRLPSIVLGTATVPLLYALGAATVGRGPGLVAAGIYAVGPFAVFYGSEGRAYATMVFLVCLAVLCLVRAVRGGGWGWWAGWAFAAAGAFYSHYTAVFTLGAAAAWAAWAHRERWRELATGCAAAAILVLPWVPAYLEQNRNEGIDALEALTPFTAREILDGLLRVVAGHPFTRLGDVPGAVGLAALAAALLAGLGLWAVRGLPRAPREGLVLVALLALATPAGIVLYSLGGTSIYSSRTLLASLPGLALLVGWALARRPAWAVVPLAVALVAGAWTSLAPEHRRVPYSDAAAAIEAQGAPGDPIVVLAPLGTADKLGRGGPTLRSLAIHLERPQDATETAPPAAGALAAAARRAPGGRVWLVTPGLPLLDRAPPAPAPPPGLRLAGRRLFDDGFAPVAAFEYAVDR
jgi:hypothetical protein